jgi:hypothetical protein
MKKLFSEENITDCLMALGDFLLSFFHTGGIFVLALILACQIATLIPLLLNGIGVPGGCCELIAKILISICPVIPILLLSQIRREENYGEKISLDIGFSAWIVTIVYAWAFYSF